jgi:ubiquinone/menaquinone biosynthesis C-methylase UbiE
MEPDDPGIVEQGYDVVYEAWPKATTLHRIWRDVVIGPDFPDGFEHISFASPRELRALVDALVLDRTSELVDLACGAGGSGLWVAQVTGARLTGIDVSAAGLDLAEQRAAALGMAGSSRFARGSFSRTGLTAASMDAAMSLDALQYAPNKLDAMNEVFRILRPGAKFACFAFVLDAERVASIEGAWEDPVEDYREPMEAAGLEVISYESTDRWLDRLMDAYSTVVAARDSLVAEIGERAANALLFEMTLTLERRPYRDRVFFVAQRPEAPHTRIG